jgi:hypothetical protein
MAMGVVKGLLRFALLALLGFFLSVLSDVGVSEAQTTNFQIGNCNVNVQNSPNTTVIIDKNTDCVRNLPKSGPRPAPLVISGRWIFNGTNNIIRIPNRDLIFENGSEIRVKNGSSLTIEAASIRVKDGRARIDGGGEPGDRGGRGQDNGKVWISRTKGEFDQAVNDCRGNPNHRERGGRGRPGGSGGPGATIRLSRPFVGTLEIDVSGGVGGQGGPGGSGETLKNGPSFTCDGCTTGCGDGEVGPTGDTGPKGHLFIAGREVSSAP